MFVRIEIALVHVQLLYWFCGGHNVMVLSGVTLLVHLRGDPLSLLSTVLGCERCLPLLDYKVRIILRL